MGPQIVQGYMGWGLEPLNGGELGEGYAVAICLNGEVEEEWAGSHIRLMCSLGDLGLVIRSSLRHI